MIAWINVFILVVSSILVLYFYVRSVSPAGQEMIAGEGAYRRCFYYRLVSAFFEFIILGNFIVYIFYPLPTPLPDRFPWSWWISIIIGLIIGIPAMTLLVIGSLHAGSETLRPQKEHVMYGGIYRKIRHPQAVGEVFLFPVIGLLLHSPFLTVFSLIYFPIFIIMCFAEEQDLLLRYGQAYANYCKKTGAFWPTKG